MDHTWLRRFPEGHRNRSRVRIVEPAEDEDWRLCRMKTEVELKVDMQGGARV